MVERYDAILSEQMRREDERRYAASHNLAKEAGLQVSFSRSVFSATMIQLGTRLLELGRKVQGPFEGGASPLMARAK
jgi:hypothetical protein